MSATQGNVDLLVSEFFKKQQEALSKKMQRIMRLNHFHNLY